MNSNEIHVGRTYVGYLKHAPMGKRVCAFRVKAVEFKGGMLLPVTGYRLDVDDVDDVPVAFEYSEVIVEIPSSEAGWFAW